MVNYIGGDGDYNVSTDGVHVGRVQSRPQALREVARWQAISPWRPDGSDAGAAGYHCGGFASRRDAGDELVKRAAAYGKVTA